MTPAFSMFAPVIKASRKVAEDVAKLLRKLTFRSFRRTSGSRIVPNSSIARCTTA